GGADAEAEGDEVGGVACGVVGLLDVAIELLGAAPVVDLGADEGGGVGGLHELGLAAGLPDAGAGVLEAQAVAVLVGDDVGEEDEVVGERDPGLGGVELHGAAAVGEEVLGEDVAAAVDVAGDDADVAAVRVARGAGPDGAVVGDLGVGVAGLGGPLGEGLGEL